MMSSDRHWWALTHTLTPIDELWQTQAEVRRSELWQTTKRQELWQTLYIAPSEWWALTNTEHLEMISDSHPGAPWALWKTDTVTPFYELWETRHLSPKYLVMSSDRHCKSLWWALRDTIALSDELWQTLRSGRQSSIRWALKRHY
jgi:hypothetical protein